MVTDGKRKGEHVFDSSGSTAKMKRSASDVSEVQPKTQDLLILGLSYSAEESDVTEYFEKFGPVVMTQV